MSLFKYNTASVVYDVVLKWIENARAKLTIAYVHMLRTIYFIIFVSDIFRTFASSFCIRNTNDFLDYLEMFQRPSYSIVQSSIYKIKYFIDVFDQKLKISDSVRQYRFPKIFLITFMFRSQMN